jgi:hypothetical protein
LDLTFQHGSPKHKLSFEVDFLVWSISVFFQNDARWRYLALLLHGLDPYVKAFGPIYTSWLIKLFHFVTPPSNPSKGHDDHVIAKVVDSHPKSIQLTWSAGIHVKHTSWRWV